MMKGETVGAYRRLADRFDQVYVIAQPMEAEDILEDSPTRAALARVCCDHTAEDYRRLSHEGSEREEYRKIEPSISCIIAAESPISRCTMRCPE